VVPFHSAVSFFNSNKTTNSRNIHMRKSKTSKKTKVKVRDLRPKKNAKGGGRVTLMCATGEHIKKAVLTN
jgi:hypothetical protein